MGREQILMLLSDVTLPLGCQIDIASEVHR